MLTVVLACDASGNSSPRRPLGKPYSGMPSTDGPWLTPGGSAACALQPKARKKTAANTLRIECDRENMEMWSGEGADYTSGLKKEVSGQWTFGSGESSVRESICRASTYARNGATHPWLFLTVDVYVNVI